MRWAIFTVTLASLVSLFAGTFLADTATAQFRKPKPAANATENGAGLAAPAGGINFGETITQHWAIGMSITASRGNVTGIKAYTAIPKNWPEQSVRLLKKEKTQGVVVGTRGCSGMADMMEVKISSMPAGAKADVLYSYEIKRKVMKKPQGDMSSYRKPTPKEITQDRLTSYLGVSELIETNAKEIKLLAQETVKGKKTFWEGIEALYRISREKIQYKKGPIRGALKALLLGEGDCEDMSSLFIALCRNHQIPARIVWVPGHCYAEFYLVDINGVGTWFPCELTGPIERFGYVDNTQLILQKGDKVRVPYKTKNGGYIRRYAAENLVGAGSRPTFKAIRKQTEQ